MCIYYNYFIQWCKVFTEETLHIYKKIMVNQNYSVVHSLNVWMSRYLSFRLSPCGFRQENFVNIFSRDMAMIWKKKKLYRGSLDNERQYLSLRSYAFEKKKMHIWNSNNKKHSLSTQLKKVKRKRRIHLYIDQLKKRKTPYTTNKNWELRRGVTAM